MDRDDYLKLINNCSTLVKVINVLKRILSAASGGSFASKKEILNSAAWHLLARCHQKYFIYKSNKNQQILTEHGVNKINLRITTQDGEQLCIDNNPILICHTDKRLVYLLINNAHIKRISPSLMPAHMGVLHTLAALRGGNYPVYLSRSRECVKTHINRCVTCLKVFSVPQKVAEGSPRYVRHLKQSDLLFSVVSVDHLGPCYRSAFLHSRKSVKYWLLYILCVVSGGVSIQQCEDYSHASVVLALYNHSQIVGKAPQILYCDAGSSIAPKMESEIYKSYFGEHKMDVIKVEASHQYLNQSERSIKVFKSIMRSLLLQRDKLHLKNLSYQQVTAVLHCIANIMNSVPLQSAQLSNDTFLSVNHYLKPGWLIHQNNINLDSSRWAELQMSLDILSKEFGAAQQEFVKFMKVSLVAPSRRLLSQHPNLNPFKPGDLCLVFRKDNYGLGKIIRVHPQYCDILSSETKPPKMRHVHCNSLVLIYRRENIDGQSEDNPSCNDQSEDNLPGQVCHPHDQEDDDGINNDQLEAHYPGCAPLIGDDDGQPGHADQDDDGDRLISLKVRNDSYGCKRPHHQNQLQQHQVQNDDDISCPNIKHLRNKALKKHDNFYKIKVLSSRQIKTFHAKQTFDVSKTQQEEHLKNIYPARGNIKTQTWADKNTLLPIIPIFSGL